MQWRIHDPDRPLPPVVNPGPDTALSRPIPTDAVVLFDGSDLQAWERSEGGDPGWKVENGYMEIVGGSGSIRTRQAFGSCQLHAEFRMPDPPEGEGQGRGNSGVFLMDLYEVQILDCFENETYADGMSAAVYGQYPPLVNACRPPGQWQSYDIIFYRPLFDDEGEVARKARMTIFHNDVLVHDAAELTGPTAWRERPPYEAHPARLPLSLQDHGYPVRFRNIWIREIEGDRL